MGRKLDVAGRRLPASLIAIGVLLLAACQSGGQQPAASAGARITIALGSEPTTLDPLARDDGNERAVTDNIYETLIKRTADGKLEPGLAAAMPTQVNPTTWQFKLRRGIKFTDGEPLNADAVVATVQRVLDPSFKSEQLSFLGSIVGAKKVDDTTVDIISKDPNPLVPASMYWLRIVPPRAAHDSGFASKPVGTGPYVLEQWVKGDHITLKANPSYWGPKPPIQEVTYRFVEEPGTRLSGLLNGEFDLIENLSPDDASKAPKVATVDGGQNSLVILNTMSGITADPRVRAALNYAVDKQALASKLFDGYATVENCQFMSPDWFGYNPSLQPIPYDPTKAKQLLQEANAIGASIDLTSTSGRWLKDREETEAVADYWRAVGLKVNVSILEFNDYLNRLFDQKNRPQAIFLDHDNALFDASRTMDAYFARGGTGTSNNDPQLTQLVNAGDKELNQQARLQDYQQAAKLACDGSYFTFLVRLKDVYGLSKRLVWRPRTDGKIFVSEMKLAS
jgi:peptide/nickel transport system substrate-binding protein